MVGRREWPLEGPRCAQGTRHGAPMDAVWLGIVRPDAG
jgi:hypothetical protein